MQIVISSTAWDSLPFHLRPKLKAIVRLLLTSRAESTVKKYVTEIKKLLQWSLDNKIIPSLPLSTAVVAVYLSDLLTQQHRPASGLAIVYAALKWFQAFIPAIHGTNPLDDSYMRVVGTSLKVQKEPENVLSLKRSR